MHNTNISCYRLEWQSVLNYLLRVLDTITKTYSSLSVLFFINIRWLQGTISGLPCCTSGMEVCNAYSELNDPAEQRRYVYVGIYFSILLVFWYTFTQNAHTAFVHPDPSLDKIIYQIEGWTGNFRHEYLGPKHRASEMLLSITRPIACRTEL